MQSSHLGTTRITIAQDDNGSLIKGQYDSDYHLGEGTKFTRSHEGLLISEIEVLKDTHAFSISIDYDLKIEKDPTLTAKAYALEKSEFTSMAEAVLASFCFCR